MIFVGIGWSERHHDVCVVDADGTQLARVRVPEGIEGLDGTALREISLVGSQAGIG